MSYEQILRMIVDACNNAFYDGMFGTDKARVIECATKIYIAQRCDSYEEE